MKEQMTKSQAGRGRRLNPQIKKSLPLYVFLLPAIIYLILFNYVPIYGVQIAFKNFSSKAGIWGSPWVGLDHFAKFIKSPNFTLLLKNTFVLGIYTLATFPCAIIFALMVNEVRNTKFKKSVQMISYMPHFLSTVVVCAMLKLFFHPTSGVINMIIQALGGTGQDFMTVPEYFADIYVWSGVWQQIGWNSIIYISALAGVSSELVEAAEVDGAGRLGVIWHVYIPSILPTIAIMLILSCGNVLSVGFEKVFLMQNSLNLSASQVISTYVYEIGLKGGQFSYSSAIGLFNNVISVVLIGAVNWITKKMTGSGIW